MLTNDALYAIRRFLRDSITCARYKIGEEYYTTPIQGAEVLNDGRVAISFLIENSETEIINVTEAQLCDADGTIWASKPEDIVRSEVQEGIFYRFYFTVEETVKS